MQARSLWAEEAGAEEGVAEEAGAGWGPRKTQTWKLGRRLRGQHEVVVGAAAAAAAAET